MTEYGKLVAEIPENYPEHVKTVLRDDILNRSPDDNVRIAYELAEETHKKQNRKGRDKLPYITHPLRVYDFVNNSIDKNYKKRNIMLAASLLHDCAEDYRPDYYDKNNPESKQRAMDEFYEKLRDKFTDKNFADAVVSLVKEVTNPITFTDVSGNIIEKEQWQVEHMKNPKTSIQARILKICDQSANLQSDLEEVPENWDYNRLTAYRNKASAVVNAALQGASKVDVLECSPKDAGVFYKTIASYAKYVLDDMEKNGHSIPPAYDDRKGYATLTIEGLKRSVKGIKKGAEI